MQSVHAGFRSILWVSSSLLRVGGSRLFVLTDRAARQTFPVVIWPVRVEKEHSQEKQTTGAKPPPPRRSAVRRTPHGSAANTASGFDLAAGDLDGLLACLPGSLTACTISTGRETDSIRRGKTTLLYIAAES